MSNVYQKRKLVLAWTALECFFFGGLAGGYLRYLLPALVESSYYANICPLDKAINDSNVTLEDALRLGEAHILNNVQLNAEAVDFEDAEDVMQSDQKWTRQKRSESASYGSDYPGYYNEHGEYMYYDNYYQGEFYEDFK